MTDPAIDDDLDGWAEDWRRVTPWLGLRMEALGIDAEGMEVRSSTGHSLRRAEWRSVRSIAARKALEAGPRRGRRPPRARWFMDIAVGMADGVQTFSVEVTGLDAAWPQVLHSCRSAWAAAQVRERQTARPRRSGFSWPEARYTLRWV
jgi:hypothetical protein